MGILQLIHMSLQIHKKVGLFKKDDPLSYDLEFEKAGDKTRTCDRLITNQLLYQLSYTSNLFNVV